MVVAVAAFMLLVSLCRKAPPIRGVREQFDRGWGAGRGIGDEVNKQLTRCPRGLGVQGQAGGL